MAITKHRISIRFKLGPYATRDAAITAQKQMKRDSPGIKFTAMKKIGKGYKFEGKMSSVKAVNATSIAVKQVVQQQVPAGTIVTVDNLSRKSTKRSSW